MSTNNPPTSDTSWTTIVSKSLKAKVPPPRSRNDIAGNREVYQVETLFEDPETTEYLRQQRALSIVKTAIQPGAVIFSFPSRLFSHQTDAYKLVVSKLGPVIGNYFNPVSLRGARSRNELVFYTRFREAATTQKALSEGITINEVQYKAIPYKDKTTTNDYVRVNLTLDPTDETDELIDKLKSSMANYGRVLQIKQLLVRGFFQGDVSVLLDRKQSETQRYQELQRMMYLDAWDVMAPATYRGAKPICFYCREAGHVRKDCEELQKIICFKCGGSGHTQRRCEEDKADKSKKGAKKDGNKDPEAQKADSNKINQSTTKETTFAEDVQVYENLTQTDYSDTVINKSTTDLPTDSQVDAVFVDADSDMDDSGSGEKDDVQMDESTSSEDAGSSALKPLTGSLASKYAPIDLRTSMDVEKTPSLGASSNDDQRSLSSDSIMKDSSSSSSSSITSARKGHE